MKSSEKTPDFYVPSRHLRQKISRGAKKSRIISLGSVPHGELQFGGDESSEVNFIPQIRNCVG